MEDKIKTIEAKKKDIESESGKFFYEFDENRYSKMENYGYNASKLRTQSIINVHEFMGKTTLEEVSPKPKDGEKPVYF